MPPLPSSRTILNRPKTNSPTEKAAEVRTTGPGGFIVGKPPEEGIQRGTTACWCGRWPELVGEMGGETSRCALQAQTPRSRAQGNRFGDHLPSPMQPVTRHHSLDSEE